MKASIYILVIVFFLLAPNNLSAQLLKKMKDKVEKKIDKKIDGKLENKEDGEPKKNEPSVAKNENTTETDNPETKVSTSYTSKFDFIPGETLIISDDFSEDVVGDFPALWFTNGSGEVVTIDGQDGKWLMIKGRSQAFIDRLLELPDNFTVQFDLLCSVPLSWSSGVFNLYMEDIVDLARYRKGDNGGEMSSRNINYQFWLDLHPGVYNPGTYTTKGYGHYRLNNVNAKLELNEMWMPSAEKSLLKVSIWRQGQRLRLYLNENKILDLPKILPEDMNPNLFVFEPHSLVDGDHYFIGNLRIAVGSPDTRNKLLNEGKLVTNGILFSVNSDIIKPESYGILKEIAGILKERGDIKVMIVGHTDSDGEADANLTLSEKRAASVKNYLVSNFAINVSNLQTSGKGEINPIADNTNATGKAQNRRVEFIKM